jgi:hypothetical protein
MPQPDFKNFQSLKAQGYTGFHTIAELIHDPSSIPAFPGVYMILYRGYLSPGFLKLSHAGLSKEADTSMPIGELKQRWIKETPVIYIGKTGGSGFEATLHSRIGQLLSYGQGKSSNHRGGRYIWQIANHTDLAICWMPLTADIEPAARKKELLSVFRAKYGKNPFANIVS